jgi:hypothetical protein
VAGKPTQGRRDGDAGGEGSERGCGVAGAHGCLIGSPAVGWNCLGRPGPAAVDPARERGLGRG